MVSINVDWSAIRPINGSRQDGFEALCSQLADAERPSDTKFIRKGTPDAGVECYATFANGEEWGWQAKYFDTIGDSQWAQIDDSVQTALEKHPRLVRYYVCVPYDLPDARIENRRSARQRWEDHEKKWSGWAQARGMKIEFLYWGSHELLELLSRPEHIGRLRFWFDVHGFDAAWFQSQLETAIRSAGPRYTPETNIQLSISEKFDALGRTTNFFNGLIVKARPVREKLSHVQHIPVKGSTAFQNLRVDVSKIDELTSQKSGLTESINQLLDKLGARFESAGPLPFQTFANEIDRALDAADSLEDLLLHFEDIHSKAKKAEEKTSDNPFRAGKSHLYELKRELRGFRDTLLEADGLASSSLLILTGHAGTGKTHLACDIAKRRLGEGRPTILLMGQRFLSNDDPWRQALNHLDLSHISAEEFIGSLEAAAQAAGYRALVIIDALNEGAGRQIWPNHLSAFLSYLSKSSWISIVLTVRSSYEEIIIPIELHNSAMILEHHGFQDHEFDAVRTFFDYYGIERPSSPILTPEFQNPLFLKILCCGLNASGKKRFPRGFNGISIIFSIFLESINARLATELDFNKDRRLVRRAVENFASALVDADSGWLPLETAEDLINALLPGREFERSLYRGLVSEGLIIQEGAWSKDKGVEEVVHLAYERLSDHLVAKKMLDCNIDPEKPEEAFGESSAFGYLGNPRKYISSGVLEALCVQVPERTGKELTELCPGVAQRHAFPEAFRQSLIWRASSAFSATTTDIFRQIIRNQYQRNALFDVLVTLATIPDHPFNASFLHRILASKKMADRDADWSIFLHHTWDRNGAVNRLVDWACSVDPHEELDEESVDLSTKTLAWMLTTSNRSLRDRATKALVSLVTGRFPAVSRLVDTFSRVDDPYVVERIYAVAYGCAVRSFDTSAVGQLAQIVYDRVFREGCPPAHILLRDYARGVIERALYLEANIDVTLKKIRPPYESIWPQIPAEADIKPLRVDFQSADYDKAEWARGRIGTSVLNDDFARYIIGTNTMSTNWLSVRLDEPQWKSPEQLLEKIIEEFSEEEKIAWTVFEAADRAEKMSQFARTINWKGAEEAVGKTADDAEKSLELAEAALLKKINPSRVDRLRKILALRGSGDSHPPKFDLRLVQRYILWRVFDLGWTTERFGRFDNEIGYRGRDALKAERIGKKYQWIAYHEIQALISDHFQYYDYWAGDYSYDGPWQDRFRDIDPSSTLFQKPGPEFWDNYPSSWWASSGVDDWSMALDHREWVKKIDDLPLVIPLLQSPDPNNCSNWLSLYCSQGWTQPTPLDYEPYRVERRSVWYIINGFLVRIEDVISFMKWAESIDFWGRWMPEPPEHHKTFLGEYHWAPAAQYLRQPYHGDNGWTTPEGCPVSIKVPTLTYVHGNGFDSSAKQGFSLRLPAAEIVGRLGLRWTGRFGDYMDESGNIVVYDPTVYSIGPPAVLIRQDAVKALEQNGISLCWTVLGQKLILSPDMVGGHLDNLRLSGVLMNSEGGPTGFIKYTLETGSVHDGSHSLLPLGEIRM